MLEKEIGTYSDQGTIWFKCYEGEITMNNNRKELISKIGVKQYQIIADLVDDLGWDYQSMTTRERNL